MINVHRFYAGEVHATDSELKVSMLGPQDPDPSGMTPEDLTEEPTTFALQFNDGDDVAVFFGDLAEIERTFVEALAKVQEVIREQAEDSK